MSINPIVNNNELSKNTQIKATLKATKQRRALKRCRTINLKIQKNKLNKQQLEHLFMLFIEAKWIYNHILNDIKILITKTLALKYLFASKYSIENKDKNIIHSHPWKTKQTLYLRALSLLFSYNCDQ